MFQKKPKEIEQEKNNTSEHRLVDLAPFLNQMEFQNQLAIEKEELRKQHEEDRRAGLRSVPITSVAILQQFTDKNRSLIYRLMLKKIKVAIDKNLTKADLFRLGNTPQVASVNKESFKTSLNEMIAWFVKNEEYEYAADAKKLLSKFCVNEIIEKSK